MDPNLLDDHSKQESKSNLSKSLTDKRTKDHFSFFNSNYRLNHKSNGLNGLVSNSNDAQTHSFITDVADVRQMEQGLLHLLDDFHSGKLQAFCQDITFEKMESVREQQEKLAKLHFDLNNQELFRHDTEDGRRIAKENMSKLIENLQQLSFSIEQLQSRSSGGTSKS